MVNLAKGIGFSIIWFFLSLIITSGCSTGNFEATNPDTSKQISRNDGDATNDADGADGSDPANDADSRKNSKANDADGKKTGGQGDSRNKRDGDDGKGRGADEDFSELEPHLRDCGSFNGKSSVTLKIPGGPNDQIDLRDYDEGGEVRDNNVTGGQTYIFHMKYYRLKKSGGGKPDYVRDVHDPDYDEVMYRALIDLPEGQNLASADCDTRAYELSESSLENRLEARDNFNGGCFAKDTEVTLADGSSKPIYALQGDENLWNPVLRKAIPIKRIIKGPEKTHGLIEITVGTKKVRVTTEHPFETKSGLKQARNLSIKDELLNPLGSFSAITKISQLPLVQGEIVWNVHLDTPDDLARSHMILADGVVTGDLYLQQQLAQEKSMGMTAQTAILPQPFTMGAK